jgi:hypothetical protein
MSAMAELENGTPLLLIKKLGGTILLIVGCALAATGFSTDNTGLATTGIILLAIGALLLVLKIMRRNQVGPWQSIKRPHQFTSDFHFGAGAARSDCRAL